MSFEQFGLPAALLRAVQEIGYTVPTPIQTAAIPAVHDGRDLLAAAQTGTGKTAAFALPLLQRLDAEQPNPRGSRAPRLLVRVPPRELAAAAAGPGVPGGAATTRPGGRGEHSPPPPG